MTIAASLSNKISDVYSTLSSIPDLKVITPSSPDYTITKQPYNLRISTSPSFITIPSSVQQIQSIVRCAATFHLTVSARSGGHSYGAYGLAGDIVVDLSALKGIILNADGSACVQTGNKLGDVATSLFNHGGRGLPHGTCPMVGTGGHTLYGGFGLYSRVGGLVSDRVISAEVVLADGSLITASKDSHTDIFWAIRGGGPSFGLVTAWTFDTFIVPPTVVSYVISLGIQPASEIIAAYSTWQSFIIDAPNELGIIAYFDAGEKSGTLFMKFWGDYYGNYDEFEAVISPLLKKLPSNATLTATPMDWLEALKMNSGDAQTLDTSIPMTNTFLIKSLVETTPLSESSLTTWINYMATIGTLSKTKWRVQADLWGGEISSFPVDSTAFAHRDAFLVFQLFAASIDRLPPYPEEGFSFLEDMVRTINPHPRGAYPNYIDPTLVTPIHRTDLYFGKHAEMLRQIKLAVDPNNIFGLF